MNYPLLSRIDSPADLRLLPEEELPQLARELREFIIRVVAAKAGHLGASLGVVELTVALHYCFQTPDDKLVWDVGHQAYGHKILTGRRSRFHTNRQPGGISGFPKRSESPYDTFGTGHSSTAISAALGMALASRLEGALHRHHVAVVGDASIASGMAFEAMNHAGVTDANLLIVLNDNAIGIDPSVGALKNYLAATDADSATRQDTVFNALNLPYHGPVDGHDISALLSALEEMKQLDGPRLLHVVTTKGKGLKQAEKDQVRYHAPGRFDADTGELIQGETGPQPPKFQDVFGLTLVELARTNQRIIGITPAMPTGSSLKYMMEEFPERAFDVGIAEQHAVTLAAGLATEGYRVYCNIYSTFLQRAYDQVIHDVCLQKLPVVFCLDRAGVVGEDGPTHHGIFDLAYLRCIPDLKIAAPRDARSLRNLLYSVQGELDGPVAIRYPRGRSHDMDWQVPFQAVQWGKAEELLLGEDIAVLTVGPACYTAKEAIARAGMPCGLYDMGYVKPLDEEALHNICQRYSRLITVEDGVIAGGFGSAILEFMAKHEYHQQLTLLGVDDNFPSQGPPDLLMAEEGYGLEAIYKAIVNP